MPVRQLTDICVKNGGDHFLSEVTSREFMDNLVSILKMPGLNHSVRDDILKYIQNWSLAFEGKPSLSYVNQVYKTLKSEGIHLVDLLSPRFTLAAQDIISLQRILPWRTLPWLIRRPLLNG
jgi:hypothetical protein